MLYRFEKYLLYSCLLTIVICKRRSIPRV